MPTKLELIVFAREHQIHYAGLSKAQLEDRIRQAGYDPDDPHSAKEGDQMTDQSMTTDQPGPDSTYAGQPSQTDTENGEGVEEAPLSEGIRGSMYHGPFPANATFDPSVNHNVDPDPDQSPEEDHFAEWHGEAHAAFEAQREALGPAAVETPAQTQEREQAAHEEAVAAKQERSEDDQTIAESRPA